MSYKKFEKDLEKKLKVVAVNGKAITPTSVHAPEVGHVTQHRRLPRRLPKNVPELGVLERSIATITSPFIELSRGALDIGEGLLDETLGNILIGGSKAIDKIAGTELSDDAEKLVAKKFIDDYFDKMTLLKDRYRYDNAVTNTVDEVGNVLGNVAAQYILGLPGAAIGYGGQKLEDKLNEGSSYGKAVASSVGTIGAQIAADKILGGVIKGKNIDNRTFASPVLASLFKNGGDDAVKATGKQMLKNVLKGTKNQIVVAGKEWGEETLENVLDTLIDNVIYGENEALLPSLEEFLQTGKISALTTIILGAGGDYVNRNYANKIKQDIDTIRSSDEYINGDADTRAALDTEINNMIKDYQSRFNESEVNEDVVKKDKTTKKGDTKKGDTKQGDIDEQVSTNLGDEISLSSSVEDLLARKTKLTDWIDGSKQLLGSVEAFSNKKELATITKKRETELKEIEEELKKRSVKEQEQVIDTELDSISSEMREDLSKGVTSNTVEQENALNEIMNRASELDKDSKVKFNTNKAKVLQNKKKNLADATKLVNDLNYLLTGENYGKVRIAPPDTAAHKMATELGALFGKQVVFVSSPFDLSGMKMEGNDDLLILNHDNNVMSTAVDKESGEKISVNTNLAYTVLHETFHTMKSDTDTNLYNDFMDYIRNTTSDEQLTEYVMYRYGKDSELANQMMANKDNLIEEIGADEFAKLLTDQKTLKKLRVNDESLFKRVIDYIKNMIDAVSQTYFKSPLTKAQVDSLRRILDANINNTEIDVMKEVEKTIGYNPVEMKELEEGISKLEADEQRKKEKLQRQEEKELKKLDRDIRKLEKAEKTEKAKTSKKKELPSKSNKEIVRITNTGAILNEEYQQEQIRKAKEEGYRQGFKDAGGVPQNTREQSANRTTPKFKEVYAEGTFRNLKGKLTEFRDKLEKKGVLNDKDKVRVTELVRQVNESKLDLSDDQINAFIQLSDYVAKPKVKKSKTETTKVNKKEDTTKDIVHPIALTEEPVETVTITSSESENTPKVETIEKTPSKKKETTKKETTKKEPKKKVADKVVPKTEVQEVVKAIPKEERPFASDIIVAKVDNPKTVDDVEVVSPSDIIVEETITDTPTEEVTQVNEETKLQVKLETMKYELEKSFGKGDQQKNINNYLEYKKLGGKEIPKFEYFLNKPKEVEQAYSRVIPDALEKVKLPTKSESKVEKTVEQPSKTEKDVKAEIDKQVNFLRTKVTDLDKKISSDKKLNKYIPTMLNMYDRYLSLGGEKLSQIEAYKNTELNSIVNDMIKSEDKKEVSKVEEAPKITKEDTIKPKVTKETKTDKLPTKKLEKKTETESKKLNKTQMLKKVRDDLAWYQYNLDENYLTSAIDQYQEYKNAGGKIKVPELDEIIEQRKNGVIEDAEITGPSDEELRQLEAKLVVKKTPDLPKADKPKPSLGSKEDFRAKMAQMGFKFDVGTKENGKYKSKFYDNINEKTDPRFVEIVKNIEKVDSKLGMISRESNADAKERALENLRTKGVDEEYGRLTAQNNGKYTNSSSTESDFELAVLAKMYMQNGDEYKARECMNALQETATNSGRHLQAMSAIKYSSPELYTLSLIDELSRVYKENVNSHIKNPMIKAWISEVEKKGGVENLLSPEEHLVMASLVTEAFKLPDTDSAEYKQRIALANKIVADKMPRKIGEQLMNARKLSMLLSPKTLLKNKITAYIGHPVNLATTSIGSIYDAIISDMTTYDGTKLNRTMGNLTRNEIKDIKPFVDKAVERAKLENTLGISTQDGANLDYQRDPFNPDTVLGKYGNSLTKAVYGRLNVSDQKFYARYFEGSLKYQMRANNVTKPTAEMIAIATHEADVRTYKNKNSRLYQQSKKIINFLNQVDIDGFRLGDTLAPFILTPSNIASLAVHYSPVGAIDAIQKGKKFKSMLDNDSVSREDVLIAKHDFVQSMSQATVGSLMFVAAHVLAKAGLTTGDEDEDKETAEFMKAVGFKPYSFKIGGKYITYDWAQPYTTPLAIMSEFERIRNKDDLDSNILEEFKQLRNVATDSVLNMTSLDAIKTFIAGDGYGDDDWWDRTWDTIFSLPQSFIPPVVKQTADFIDPNQKQVYDKNPLKYGINQVIEGIPFLKSMLENKMNVLGEVPQQYTGLGDNPIFRLADVYINPSNVGSDRSKQYLTKELLDVYNHTGVDSILPTQVNSVISYKVDGKQMDVKLSTSQRNEIIGETGKILSNAVSELLLNDSYVGLDYDQKAELLKALGSYARGKAIADSGYAKGYAPTTGDYATINKYIDSGLSTANALTYKQIINKIEGEKDINGETIEGTKQGNKAYAIMQMDISDDQKNVMLSLITTSKTPETVDSLSNLLTISQYHSYFAMNKKDTFISEKISRADYVIAATMGIDTDTFLNYANDVSAITADYDANGNAIPNSKRNKIFNYINKLPGLNIAQKAYLLRNAGYSAKQYQGVVYNYINSLPISAIEKNEIWQIMYGN